MTVLHVALVSISIRLVLVLLVKMEDVQFVLELVLLSVKVVKPITTRMITYAFIVGIANLPYLAQMLKKIVSAVRMRIVKVVVRLAQENVRHVSVRIS